MAARLIRIIVPRPSSHLHSAACCSGACPCEMQFHFQDAKFQETGLRGRMRVRMYQQPPSLSAWGRLKIRVLLSKDPLTSQCGVCVCGGPGPEPHHGQTSTPLCPERATARFQFYLNFVRSGKQETGIGFITRTIKIKDGQMRQRWSGYVRISYTSRTTPTLAGKH